MADELETRVKALEADLASVHERITALRAALGQLANEIDELRRSARRVY